APQPLTEERLVRIPVARPLQADAEFRPDDCRSRRPGHRNWGNGPVKPKPRATGRRHPAPGDHPASRSLTIAAHAMGTDFGVPARDGWHIRRTCPTAADRLLFRRAASSRKAD